MAVHLNLKHLHYFWLVATHGSVSAAAQAAHLTSQTISGQIKLLEEAIGAELFEKTGRRLALNETGRMVLSYADEMFRLGEELKGVLEGRLPGAPRVLNVGVAMVVPKLVAYHILEPALHSDEAVRLVCQEAPQEDLLAELAVHKLDLVLTDTPLNPTLNVKAYNHLLGDSGVGFYAARAEAPHYRDGFPKSLDGAPLLMPTPTSSLRRALEQWLERQGVTPVIAAEFEDRALMKAFGEAGAGVFTSPSVVEEDVLAKYDVQRVGGTEDLRERFYVISAERRLKHPAVVAITDAARRALFNPA
jgi:LysR family transcriptional activator of nhaA